MNYIEALEGWGIPLWILIGITCIIVLSLVVEAIGKIFGKKIPVCALLAKPFKVIYNKRKNKQTLLQNMQDTLNKVNEKMPHLEAKYSEAIDVIKEFNKHYNATSINERDKWMLTVNSDLKWAHDRAKTYDASVNELLALKEIVQEQTNQIKEHTNQLSVVTNELRVNNEMTNLTKEMTAQLYKDINRKRILDFAHEIINNSRKDEIVYYTEEEVKKVRDTYTDYEEFLNTYGGSNGEVDDAMEVIRDMCKGAYKNIHIISNVRKINAE